MSAGCVRTGGTPLTAVARWAGVSDNETAARAGEAPREMSTTVTAERAGNTALSPSITRASFEIALAGCLSYSRNRAGRARERMRRSWRDTNRGERCREGPHESGGPPPGYAQESLAA